MVNVHPHSFVSASWIVIIYPDPYVVGLYHMHYPSMVNLVMLTFTLLLKGTGSILWLFGPSICGDKVWGIHGNIWKRNGLGIITVGSEFKSSTFRRDPTSPKLPVDRTIPTKLDPHIDIHIIYIYIHIHLYIYIHIHLYIYIHMQCSILISVGPPKQFLVPE